MATTKNHGKPFAVKGDGTIFPKGKIGVFVDVKTPENLSCAATVKFSPLGSICYIPKSETRKLTGDEERDGAELILQLQRSLGKPRPSYDPEKRREEYRAQRASVVAARGPGYKLPPKSGRRPMYD